MKSSGQNLEAWIKAHESIFEVFIDAACIVDTDSKVVHFNTAFMDLCGESYRKVLKIGLFADLIQTEAGKAACPVKKILETKAPVRLDELTGISKAYPQLQMIFSGIPITDTKGKCLGALVTIRNVSAENELQKKYDERKKESVTDGLTKLYNKVYTESMLLKILKSHFREPIGLTVIMTDIDHFKKVNDTYGHRAGDHVLSLVAQMLKNEARDSDVVGRFGGEEFIAILTNSDQKGAKIFAERFRKKVESCEIVFEGKIIPVTVSIGSSSFSDPWKDGMKPESIVSELVTQADTSLYFAKANGRNQVCQFEDLPKSESTTMPKKKAA